MVSNTSHLFNWWFWELTIWMGLCLTVLLVSSGCFHSGRETGWLCFTGLAHIKGGDWTGGVSPIIFRPTLGWFLWQFGKFPRGRIEHTRHVEGRLGTGLNQIGTGFFFFFFVKYPKPTSSKECRNMLPLVGGAVKSQCKGEWRRVMEENCSIFAVCPKHERPQLPDLLRNRLEGWCRSDVAWQGQISSSCVSWRGVRLLSIGTFFRLVCLAPFCLQLWVKDINSRQWAESPWIFSYKRKLLWG